jgi:hypothetical protein
MKGFFIPNYHIYWTDRFPGRKDGTAVAVGKGLPPLVPVEARGVCIPTDNSEILLTEMFINLQVVPGLMWTSLSS